MSGYKEGNPSGLRKGRKHEREKRVRRLLVEFFPISLCEVTAQGLRMERQLYPMIL